MLNVSGAPVHTGPSGCTAMVSVGSGVGVRVTVTVALATPVLHSPAVGVTSTRTWSPETNVLLLYVGPVATATLLNSQRKVGVAPALVGTAVKVRAVPGHCSGGATRLTPVVTVGCTRTVTTLETAVEQVPVPEVAWRRKKVVAVSGPGANVAPVAPGMVVQLELSVEDSHW